MSSPYFVDRAACAVHTIFPDVTVQTTAAKRTMLSYCTLGPHAVIDTHSHPHEQVGIVVKGRALFEVGDERRELGAGDMYKIPGGVPHRVVATAEGCEALDIFHPIREEYL